MNDDARTDAVLLAASAGDDAALVTLVRRYVRSATLLAAQVLGDPASAEDFARMHSSWSTAMLASSMAPGHHR